MRYPNPAGVLAAARESNGTGPRVRLGHHIGQPFVMPMTSTEGGDPDGPDRLGANRAEILASSLRELTASSGEFIFEPATEAELRGLSGIHPGIRGPLARRATARTTVRPLWVTPRALAVVELAAPTKESGYGTARQKTGSKRRPSA